MKMISPDRVQLSADEARTLSINALKTAGYDDEQAGVIAGHVMDAALCGYEYSGLPKLLNVFEHRNLRLLHNNFWRHMVCAQARASRC